jgi:hypothetical protein
MKPTWEILLAYISVLRWPALLAAIVWYYRREIPQLLKRLKIFRFPGGAGAEFSDVVAQAKVPESSEDSGLALGAVLQQREEEIARLEQDTQELGDRLARAEIELKFERIYNIIFGSQIRLLKLLDLRPDGEDRDYIEQFYQDVARTHPDLFRDDHLDRYISFLTDNGLVEYANSKYRITQEGQVFLKFLNHYNYKTDLPL